MQKMCFDLRTQTRFRVFKSDDHEPGTHVDPWHLELRGPGGSVVFPFSGSDLCAYTTRRLLRSRLADLGDEVVQDGDHETTILLPVGRLAAVGKLLRLYRKIELSDEQKAALVERLRRGSEQATPSPQNRRTTTR